MVETKNDSSFPGTIAGESGSIPPGRYEPDDERELLQRAVSGHRPSFDRLAERYHAAVYRVAYRFFNSRDDAADAVQEVFLKAWRSLQTFQARSSFRTWLLRIAGNTCITLSQAKVRQKKSFFESIVDWFSRKPPDDPAELVVEQEYQLELRHAVERNLARLPDVYRLPVILRDVEGYTMDQIAEVLEIPEGTVKSRINRGRRLLQEALEPLLRHRSRT